LNNNVCSQNQEFELNLVVYFKVVLKTIHIHYVRGHTPS